MKMLSVAILISVVAIGSARAGNDLKAVESMIGAQISELNRLEALGSALMEDTTGKTFTSCVAGILGEVRDALAFRLKDQQDIRRIEDTNQAYMASVFEDLFINVIPLNVKSINAAAGRVIERAALCNSRRIDDFGAQTSLVLKVISSQLQTLENEMRKNFTAAKP